MLPKSLSIVVLLVIIGVGAFLRFQGLAAESLWYDEVFAVRMAAQPLSTVLAAEIFNPPLYFLSLHFWIRLIGATDEASVRLLPALLGLVSIPLVYLLTRKLLSNLQALVVTAWVSIASFHIYFAQETKTYTLHLVLTLLSSLFLWNYLKKGFRTQPLILVVLLNTMALYAHYYSVFFVAAQNLVFLALFFRQEVPEGSTQKSVFVKWTVAQFLTVLFYAPWLANMFAAAGSGGQVRRHFLLKIPQAFFSLLLGDTLIPLDEAAVRDIAGTLASYWYILLPAFLLFAGLGLESLRRIKWRSEAVVFFGILAFSPIVMAALVSLKVMLFEERYFYFLSPYLYALVVIAISSLPKRQALYSFGLVALLGLGTWNYFNSPRFGKDQWRDVVSYVEQNFREGDRVILMPNYIDICWEYYQTKELPTFKVTGDREGIEGPGWEAVKQYALNSERVWYIRSFLRGDEQVQEFKTMFPRDKKVFFPKDKGIEVYLLSGRPSDL